MVKFKPYMHRYTYIIEDNGGVNILDSDGKDITKRVMNKPFYELLMAYKSLYEDKESYKESTVRETRTKS